MQIPANISKFSDDVRTAVSELSQLVDKHSNLLRYRQEISEISPSYLKVQPIGDPEELRRFILDGIGVEMSRIEGMVRSKIDEIYTIADNYVHKQQ